MNNKQQAQEQIEALKKQINDAKETISKLEEVVNKPESAVWKPDANEDYWYNDGWGSVYCIDWDDTKMDNYRYSIGNCFETEQQAKDYRDAQIILTRLQRLADEANGEKYNPKKPEYHYYLYINIAVGRVCVGSAENNIYHYAPCFYNYDSMQDALNTLISEFGEDKVKMAISGAWR